MTGVGSYTPAMREVDTTLVRRARVFVDQREGALAEAGDLAGPIADGDVDEGVVVGELGEVVAGTVPGRTSSRRSPSSSRWATRCRTWPWPPGCWRWPNGMDGA